MVLVDSSVWIRANQNQGDLMAKVALESLLEEGEAAFCGPVKLEVLGATRRELRRRFDLHFSMVPYLNSSEASWDAAVALGRRLSDERRVTLPWNDVLIAAIASEHQCRVYSLDKHFDHFAALGCVRLYQPGIGGIYAP
jgi:predicted nucleic acid-binding protein